MSVLTGFHCKCNSCKTTSFSRGLWSCTSMLELKIAQQWLFKVLLRFYSKKYTVLIIQTKIYILYTHPTYWRIYRQSQTDQILLCLFQQTQHYNGKCYSHGGPVSGKQSFIQFEQLWNLTSPYQGLSLGFEVGEWMGWSNNEHDAHWCDFLHSEAKVASTEWSDIRGKYTSHQLLNDTLTAIRATSV